MSKLPTLDQPPEPAVLAQSLERLLQDGLPATEETSDHNLLGLRGVWARSVNPDSMFSRVAALNRLLTQEIPRIPPYRGRPWADGAMILFRLDKRTARWNLMRRYQEAAKVIPYNEDHFRTDIVPKILYRLAVQLHEDSLNYVPRSRDVPPWLDPSGDTPTLSEEHLATRERAEHEERLSRLWEYVYGLRAELLAVQRYKAWPEDEYNDEKLEAARDAAIWQLARLLQSVHEYLEQYGDRIMHGEANFNAEGLIRLAGWSGEVSRELAQRLRLLILRHPDRWEFISAAKDAGLRLSAQKSEA